MISPEPQRPSATWPWPVTERDHTPLPWARTPADRHCVAVIFGAFERLTEQGDLYADA
jgi:hypothetical protein